MAHEHLRFDLTLERRPSETQPPLLMPCGSRSVHDPGAQIADTTSDYDCQKVEERLAPLSGGGGHPDRCAVRGGDAEPARGLR